LAEDLFISWFLASRVAFKNNPLYISFFIFIEVCRTV